MPGVTPSSGGIRYGMSFSFAALQPANKAPAADIPLSWRKVLRSIRSPYLKFFLSFMTRPAIDTGLMLPVTVQAPAHLDLDGPGDMCHGGHFAVAGSANQAGADMHHVREINVVRHPVDSHPGDRLLFFPIPGQFLYFRSVPGDE